MAKTQEPTQTPALDIYKKDLATLKEANAQRERDFYVAQGQIAMLESVIALAEK